MALTYKFESLDSSKVAEVGGKNASLGEMYKELHREGIRIPDGFATSAKAFFQFLEHNELKETIQNDLDQLDRDEFKNLKATGKNIREKIMNGDFPKELEEAFKQAYHELKERESDLESVAVRSSATAEDLPEASFAGQHESYMNVNGEEELLQAIKKCYASLYTDRAIKYREDKGFENMKVALSAGVQKMVRSDKGAAGVAFTIEPDSGFEEIIFINGSWGLGDNVVGGVVKGDQYHVYKRGLREGHRCIVSKELGPKEKTLIYADKEDPDSGQKTTNTDTPKDKREQFTLSDNEATQLAAWCLKIEEHYDKPMDVEWARDGNSNELYIVQARPETVHASKDQKTDVLKQYHLKEEGKILVNGSAIGDKIATGEAKILHSPEESDKLNEGDVLITEITNPDWDPVMQKASAIITNSGGRTSHAAIVARELGAVAIVGAENATEILEDGQDLTVSCAEGSEGIVYEGIMEYEEEEVELNGMSTMDTEAMLILAKPKLAYQYAQLPIDGVGLTRLEFTITNSIKVHPLALLHFDSLKDEDDKEAIEELTQAFPDKRSYFVEKLAMAVATIAAAFYPRDVIVRMSDFKSNEYANLLGGSQFEPEEENPMLGLRGASRYYNDRYREGFKMECEAMKIVREEMDLTNVKLMIPFCRTPEEGQKVLDLMQDYGLKQGHKGLEVYVMTELPSNVIGGSDFAKIFDGFSIGSNDLTQLTLGIDRDSEEVSEIFDEKNEHVKAFIGQAIDNAKTSNRKVGLCGQAPSDFPETTRFLVEKGIDSISFSPDALAKGIKNIQKAEGKGVEH